MLLTHAWLGLVALYHVLLRQVLMCHVLLYHVQLCHVLLCHVLLYHVLASHVLLCNVLLCHVLVCHVSLSNMVLVHVVACTHKLRLGLSTLRHLWRGVVQPSLPPPHPIPPHHLACVGPSLGLSSTSFLTWVQGGGLGVREVQDLGLQRGGLA